MWTHSGISLLLIGALLMSPGEAFLETWDRNGIVNGTLLGSMREFPHQVGIHVLGEDGLASYCSGSILSRPWILTAATCATGRQLVVMFNRLNVDIDNIGNTEREPDSYSVTVAGSRVVRHPTANLALVPLPVGLMFNRFVAPIALAIDPSERLVGQVAVMPGIRQNSTLQSYGRFEIVEHDYCADEARICTLGHGEPYAIPCTNAQGGGLLVGWPTAPRLVGVFSDPQSCLETTASAYYRVSHFMDWMLETMQTTKRNDGYFV